MVTAMFGWTEPPDRAGRLRLLLDSYGLVDRTGFVDGVVARIELNRDTILRRAADGDPAFIRLEQEGHIWGMNQAIAFLAETGAGLQAAVD
jgi:hypothetical protein